MTFDFESTFRRIADRAVIRRKSAQPTLPPYQSPASARWQQLAGAMGSGWHTKASLVERCGFTLNQIHRLLAAHRKQLQLRRHGRDRRTEWRLR